MNSTTQSAGVLSFEEADELVRRQCRQILEAKQPRTEEVLLLQSLGRVLAEPVVADRDFPPFPRATRDGFALRAQDLQKEALQNRTTTLRVVGQVRAGDSYDLPVASGEAVEIMTGAAVPAGADTVVMVEHTERRTVEIENEINRKGRPFDSSFASSESLRAGYGTQSGARDTASNDDQILDIVSEEESKPEKRTEELVEIQRAASAGENIVPAGAEAKAGQELLPRGTRMGPAQIALAAAAGKARVKVCCKPKVAILSTGDELVDVVEKPGASQIRNSNSYSLAALVAMHGGDPVQLPIAPDEEGKLAELIEEGLKADMLLLSGGVSMGKFDLVETVLKKLGAEFFFTGVFIQPGKPLVFGQAGGVPFFGHPGNPVSVMATFELFARQVLEALTGAEPSRLKSVRARLKKEFKTKTGLTRFLPAFLDGELYDAAVEIVAWQGSGDMLAAARANCYLVVPPDREKLPAGEMVTVVVL